MSLFNKKKFINKISNRQSRINDMKIFQITQKHFTLFLFHFLINIQIKLNKAVISIALK